MGYTTNITARAARWSAAHWKTATFLWLACVAAAIAVGGLAGTKNLTDSELTTGESGQAEAILRHAGFRSPAGESVLVQGTPLAPEVRRVVARLRTLPGLARVRHTRTSADGRSALVEFDVPGDHSTAGERVAPALAAVRSLQKAEPRYTVAEFGEASIDHELSDRIGSDLGKAERLSLPITFVILLLAFGAFVAAGIPVVLALSAVLAAMGLDALASHVWHTTDAAKSVILLMGMAVGVDYSLFYVKREREERRRGHGEDAVVRAAATSGMAVLVSGGTVLIAMAGMVVSGLKVFTALGIGAMLVVAVAVAGSLTVLPALLGKLGDRIDRGVLAVLAAGLHRLVRVRTLDRLRHRRTLLQRLKGDGGSSRAWDAVLRVVLRRPLVAAIVAVWALVLLALPVLTMHTALPGLGDVPRSIPAAAAYDRIDHAFPGSQVPATVVVKGRGADAPAVHRAIAELRREAVATGVMNEPIAVAYAPSRSVARIDIPLRGNGDDAASRRALAALRETIVPRTLGRVAGIESAVTGTTAGDSDFNNAVKHRFPYVFAFVLGLAFVLMLLTFRSLVVPLTAIVLNLLSVGAALGVLAWVFQDGHLQGLLGFHSNGAIATWVPLFLFAVLFALSMDYHVFIVSRIKELVDGGMSTADAVSAGIRSTAGTVSAAAAVMVGVFALFATLSSLDIKQMGVGLAVAVLLDATIIRGVLLPATMKLLGRANWYLPRGLAWLPRRLGSEAAT